MIRQFMSNQKIINGERLCVIQSKQFQLNRYHQTIGGLTFQQRINAEMLKEGKGSGILISPNLVLSSAHCVFNSSYGRQNQKILFYLAANGIVDEVKDAIEVENFEITDYYRKKAHLNELKDDYCAIKLKKKVNEVYPYSNCSSITPSCPYCKIDLVQKKCLQIYGYPGDSSESENYKAKDTTGKTFLLRQEGRKSRQGQRKIEVYDPARGLISYSMTTYPGQSGCPVIYGGKMIALHAKGGGENQNYNVGRLFTPELIKNLQIWARKMGAQPFKINTQNLCPHLQKIFEIKQVSSNSINIKDKQFTEEQLKSFNNKPFEIHERASSPPRLLPPINRINIPKEYRFDQETLNSTQIGNIPNTKFCALKWINYYRRQYQVQRSSFFNPNQKKELKDKLDKELQTFWNESRHSVQHQDSYAVINTFNLLKEFTAHQKHSQISLLHLEGNYLEQINLSNNKNINFLCMDKNQLKQIKVNHLESLIVLWLRDNKIRKIDLSSNNFLAFIDLQSNGLEELILPKRGNISILWNGLNNLKKFKFFWNPRIFCHYNFESNLQFCQITISCDKKYFQQWNYFMKKLQNQYTKYKYIYIADIQEK